MDQTPHVALLPSPGMGHLIPCIEFAKQLVHHHHFSATILIPSAAPPTTAQKTVLQQLPKTIHHIFLPPVQLPNDPLSVASQISLTVTLSLPSVKHTLASLSTSTRLVSLIVDPFGIDAINVAREFGVLPYLFFPSSAMTLLFCLHLPKIDETVTGEYGDLPEPIQLPGCVPVHGRDLPNPVQDRSNKAFIESLKRYGLAEGIIVNTFVDMEEGAIKALLVDEPGKPPVYPVGPLIRTGSSDGLERYECLKWLDDQPSGSVVFVSFGSVGTLSHDQLNELALGLELSGQRFLWVVRSPSDNASVSSFNAHNQNDPLSLLPKGFLERTQGQGLVVPSWAPQIEVLSHRATGGFLTHCGWNSTLESTVHGVPLIAWPLFAEQKMNAVMLTEGLKVALRPKSHESGLVGREEIAEVVKSLMEGEDGKEVRRRMGGLKDAAAKALSDGGSSAKSLSDLAFKLKNQLNI
ncbi:Hydroquinone glucosyltransferase [Camellia lanceoleosa]|uniref:Hydroquinone glucosyltransferase n=1 Tax=Camellia lanceoleosa TaxID=1840588 RepID=A0ACC0ILK4_9ERIC|nr:Hydroquinone glucosyltransferase [Camellia lanceoleosa]